MWIVSESHRITAPGKTEHLPLILLEGPTAAEHVEAGDYLDRLQLKWAQFENIPFFSLGRRKDFDGLTFEKRTEDADQNDNQPLVRHEIWRRSYRSHPYLRPYSAEDFLQHAVQVITSMAPHFLVGGKKLPMAKVAELMERWSHVLEDAEYRRLDIKKIQRRLPDLDSLLGGGG